jgi:hypothetical protein
MDYLKGISQAMQHAEADNTSEAYSYAATKLVKNKDRVRQNIKEATASIVATIISKLDNNQPLNADEKQVVKLWAVGDAEGYLEMENNYKDWLTEYRRLMGVIAGYETKTGSLQELVEIHGVLEDAIKVADAIAHYLEDKERVARFENAINNLNGESTKFIAGFLKSMLASPEM